MSKVIKWLQENGIDFTVEEYSHSKTIRIILEKNCIWVNGFGENMYYDKDICVRYGKGYKDYYVRELTGYNTSRILLKYSTRANDVIKALERRFKEGK